MKKWCKPQLMDLNYRYTEAGGQGGPGDGVVYDVLGFKLIGTSGPPIDDPWFVPVP